MLGAMRSNKLFALARSVRLKGLLYALYRYFPRRRRLGHTPALWRWQLLIHTLANTGNLWQRFVTLYKSDQDLLFHTSKTLGNYQPIVSMYEGNPNTPLQHRAGEASQYARCNPVASSYIGRSPQQQSFSGHDLPHLL